ncbi:MAG: tetratricopeptide repeat protein, partial [Myxococcota bacterium]
QPTQLALVSQLAELYTLESRPSDAIALWHETLEQEDHLSVSDLIAVCRKLAEAIETHEDDPRRATGFLERALMEASEDPIALTPADAHAIHRRLANLYLRFDEFAAALTHLQALEVTTKDLSFLYEELGEVSRSARQFEASEQYFIRSLEQDGQNMTARIGLSETLLASGKFDNAIELLEYIEDHVDMLTEGSDRARLYATFGQAYTATGQNDKAAEMFRVALHHDPNNTIAQQATRP